LDCIADYRWCDRNGRRFERTHKRQGRHIEKQQRFVVRLLDNQVRGLDSIGASIVLLDIRQLVGSVIAIAQTRSLIVRSKGNGPNHLTATKIIVNITKTATTK